MDTKIKVKSPNVCEIDLKMTSRWSFTLDLEECEDYEVCEFTYDNRCKEVIVCYYDAVGKSKTRTFLKWYEKARHTSITTKGVLKYFSNDVCVEKWILELRPKYCQNSALKYEVNLDQPATTITYFMDVFKIVIYTGEDVQLDSLRN